MRFFPNHFSKCQTMGVVYLLLCSCNCFYVRKTIQKLWQRLYRHLRAMKTNDTDLPLGRHPGSWGGDFNKLLLQRELRWICNLSATWPPGLNETFNLKPFLPGFSSETFNRDLWFFIIIFSIRKGLPATYTVYLVLRSPFMLIKYTAYNSVSVSVLCFRQSTFDFYIICSKCTHDSLGSSALLLFFNLYTPHWSADFSFCLDHMIHPGSPAHRSPSLAIATLGQLPRMGCYQANAEVETVFLCTCVLDHSFLSSYSCPLFVLVAVSMSDVITHKRSDARPAEGWQ